jgi:DNA-binding response OmpR family regulator
MRILLVEDDADLAQFIRKGLKEERYAVDFSADGEQGLELALGNPKRDSGVAVDSAQHRGR